jgi:hypothetical protein
LDQAFETDASEFGKYLTAPLALIIHLSLGKASEANCEIAEDTLLERLKDYRLELALEELRRRTNIQRPPPL